MSNDALITETDIETLRREAGEAGDLEQVAICLIAIGRDRDWTLDAGQETALTRVYDRIEMSRTEARAECERVIREARDND